MSDNKFWALIHPGGPGGIVREEPQFREQDSEATPTEGYAVVFFPKITGIGVATLDWPNVSETFSRSPEAAKAKFMDRIAKDCTWDEYHDAGHRVRKVRMIDLGDPGQ